MLTRVTATEFTRAASNGRTKPVMLACAYPTGDEVELFAKISARCEQGAVHLAREAIAACLAGDLGLPVPQPFLVDLPPAWVAAVPDPDIRAAMAASLPVAFGSRLAGPQFATWNAGITLRPEMVEAALGIFVFDAIIQNDDRREGNANCLVLGEHLRIIDHELAFAHRLIIIGWQPPWQLGGLQRLVNPGAHIFRDKLRRAALNFDPIRAAWAALSDGRIEGYASALPAEWASAAADTAAAIRLIKDARDHIDGCLNEIKRVLA
ncbi:HipA family kinase [Roseococcus sp. SDR]|jgi:hypothetical protein|uniref:HipA family kinase n=1 Tax=Roseococcus sp. SDR TaxID=2835532 RepID=UPI003530248C